MSSLPCMVYSEILGIFICTEHECRAAFKSDMLDQHLRRKHKVPSATAKAEAERMLTFASKAETHPLADRYLRDPFPRMGEEWLPAIPNLPLFEVFKCPLCRLYFRGLRGTKAHIRSSHSTSDSVNSVLESLKDPQSLKSQSVFNGPQKLLFLVTVTSAPQDGDNDCSEQRSQALRAAFRFLETPGRERGGEQIALLDKTQNLSSHLLGIQEFLDSSNITSDQAHAFTKVKCKSKYSSVLKVMVSYLQHFSGMTPPIPTSLIEFIKIKSDNSRASFTLSLPSDTKVRYARVVTRFVMAIAGIDDIGLPQFRLPRNVIELKLAIAKNVVSATPTSEYDIIARRHILLRSLLLGEVRASKGERVLLEQVFKLIMAGFTKSNETKRARVADAEDASHTAAALQYFCLVTALGEFLSKPIGFGSADGHESELQRKVRIQSMISTESCTPAAYIRTVLSKTKRLSAAEAPQVIFALCEAHDYCGKVDNIEVPMNSLDKGSLGYAVRSLQQDSLHMVRNELLQAFPLPSGIWDRVLAFHDNLTNREAGYFFGNSPESRVQMENWSQTFTAYLSTRPRPIIETVETGEGVVMRPTKHAGQWLQKVDSLTENLYIPFHICSGGPPRVTEMNAARIRNTSNGHRTLHLYNHRLALLTSYSKTSMQYEKPKPIARFLDRTTTEIALSVITFIKPLQSSLLHSLFGASKATEDYLFCQSGELLPEGKACDKFREKLADKGVPLTVSLYRHYRTGMVKAFMKDFDQLFGDSIAFRQSGHTEATANTRYAAVELNFEEFNAATIAGFLRVNNRWHELLGISSTTRTGEVHSPYQGIERIEATNNQPTHSNVIRTVTGGRRVCLEQVQGGNEEEYREIDVGSTETPSVQFSGSQLQRKRPHSDLLATVPEKPVPIHKKPRTDVVDSVRELLGEQVEEPVFRSEAQKVATYECAMHSFWNHYGISMLVILPTGGGKTVCWAAPVLQEEIQAKREGVKCGVTVVVVPLISLQRDMLRRCKAYNLEARSWEDRFDSKASVIICPIDKVKGVQYRDFVKALCSQDLLVRIVADEVHLVVLWKYFRKFGNIRTRLRPEDVKVPLVLMTATGPPSLTREIRECLGADDCCFKAIRMETSRKNIFYTVFNTSSSSDEDMIQTSASLLLSEMLSICGNEKVIAFCFTIHDTRRFAHVLGGMTNPESVHMYYGSMSLEENEKASRDGFMVRRDHKQ